MGLFIIKDIGNRFRNAKLIEEEHRTKAKKIFNESLEKMYSLVQKYGIEKTMIEFRLMKARWESA